MKKIILCMTMVLMFQNMDAQNSVEGTEIGIDGFVSGSSLGGSFGIGPKFGFRFNENLIVGPSVRLQRTWSNFNGEKNSYNIFGGGLFLHARYQNMLFGGFEFEVLKSPVSYTIVNANKKIVPTLFLCAGFSREYNDFIRLNVGLYYDVINHVNSPFRQAYFVKVTNPTTGQVTKYVPLIYRISFFFPLDH